MDHDPRDLVERYVALWNEPDPDIRRATIRDLWTGDGAHVLDPPQTLKKAAIDVGFPAPTLEAHGYDALETRVTQAYEEFVASGEFLFQARDNAARLHDVVKFTWEMVTTSGGSVAATGLDVLVLDDQGRIRVDYQFVES